MTLEEYLQGRRVALWSITAIAIRRKFNSTDITDAQIIELMEASRALIGDDELQSIATQELERYQEES